jgi:hypothetical protein
MKLLLENWRKYLAERASDEAFSVVVDFLVDTFTNPENLEFANEEEEAEYMGEPMSAEDWEGLLGNLGLFKKTKDVLGLDSDNKDPVPAPPKTFEFFQVEPRQDQNWDRLVRIHPGVAEQLGLDPDKLDFFITLQVRYGLPEDYLEPGDSREEKDQSIGGYFTSDELVINLKSRRFNISEEQYRKLDENAVMDVLRRRGSVLRMVIEHEFTHMLNYLRSGKVFTRSKGIKRHHRRKDPQFQQGYKYVNSTEEIQARLIPIFKRVRDVGALNPTEVPESPENKLATLINLEANNPQGNKTISNIIKLLYQIYELEHKEFLNYTSKANKKRITKRFYEFAEALISK